MARPITLPTAIVTHRHAATAHQPPPSAPHPRRAGRRLGLRAAAMLISPLVPKGAVFQEPQRGPSNTSQFELTSVASTVKNLFKCHSVTSVTSVTSSSAPMAPH